MAQKHRDQDHECICLSFSEKVHAGQWARHTHMNTTLQTFFNEVPVNESMGDRSGVVSDAKRLAGHGPPCQIMSASLRMFLPEVVVSWTLV